VCDDGFFVWHNYKSHSQEIEKIIGQATKCLYQSKFDKIVYVGTSNSLYRYDLRTQVRDTLARKRVTAIWESQAQKVYFGSLDGLYVYENNYVVYIYSGTGSGQVRNITNYNGST
jgi:ligand-binding sensor domain-containing protein